MKRLLWIVMISLLGSFWIFGLAIFISIDLHLLNPIEQQKLKEGKLFWEWPSPYGHLAMHYVEKGEGSKHLLLLHGFRAHTYTWRYLIEPLAQAGYHVWAIDLIGYGLSDKPDNAPYNVDFFIQQVKAFMDAKGISQAHIVGNSMGGGLALHVALNYPESIQSLTLISALGYPMDLPTYLALGRHFSQLWLPFLPTMIRNGLKQIIFKEELISEEQVEAYRLPYRFPGGVNASLLTLQQFDNQRLIEMSKRYTTLKFPLLIIWGDHDTLIPLTHYQHFLKDFPTACRLLIPNCGHIPQEEEPKQVLTAMIEFLQTLDSKTHSMTSSH